MVFATLDEETTRVDAMVATGRVAVTVLGTTVGGHPVRLLRVGDPPPEATAQAIVLVTGTQHGNEVAGREAIIELAEDLAVTTDPDLLAVLQSHGVLLMPTCNPDGVEVLQRDNLQGIDINRDHLQLRSVEAQAIATVLHDARPGLVVDLHEGGVAENAQLLGPTNVQVDPLIAARSVNAVNAIRLHFDALGMTTGDWPGADTETILRNRAGLGNMPSLVAECDSGGTTESERIDQARAVADASLTYARLNADALLADAAAAAESRTAVGVAATAPFSLRVATLDPPPVGYQLSSAQLAATVLHRSMFGVTAAGGVLAMGQPAQPLIPFFADPDAEFGVVDGARLFAASLAGGAQVAQAQVRAVITWLACDVVTGRRIAELPDITGQVSRVLCAYTQSALSLPAPTGGPGHLPIGLLERATQPIRTMIVLVVNDVPSWAGWVKDRIRGSDATWSLPCVTLEAYYRARRIRDHTYTGEDEAVIAAGLAADAGDIAGVGLGIPITVDAVATGVSRDRTYLLSDRQTVYDGLSELAGVGLEWTVDLDWQDNRHQVVTRHLRIRHRIGRAAAVPTARFATRSSSETTYELAEDHTEGRYANFVVAYAPGEGEDQLVSDPAVDLTALATGIPIVELHWQPSSSIVDTDTLDDHATSRLARSRNGALTWHLSGRWDQPPRLNVDWALGDDIGWDLIGHGHPAGVTGVGRAIGWDFDPSSGLASPILLDPASDPEVS
jgi:hypothetical protein